jgi:hypothetical protein
MQIHTHEEDVTTTLTRLERLGAHEQPEDFMPRGYSLPDMQPSPDVGMDPRLRYQAVHPLL